MLELLTPLWAPFTELAFMRRALVACLMLALGSIPLGVLLTLRRMTLLGDAMSHAVLPGVALAFGVFGLALLPLTLGGLLAGALVALAVVALTRFTQLTEDAAFTLFYLLSLAGGVIIMSVQGTNLDLLHLLFGNILAIDDAALWLVAGVAALTLLLIALFYRGLVLGCLDPSFAALKQHQRGVQAVFMVLLVINLVAAFQALGTLLALGLMILPAIAARFWCTTLERLLPLAMAIGVVAAPIGLLLSYHLDWPSGPALVLVLGVVCLLSVLVGPEGSLRRTLSSR